MKHIPVLLLMAAFTSCFCQPTKSIDSVEVYIKKLNWESFVITTNYVSEIVLKEDALKLVELKRGNTIKQLISNIDNPEKTVVLHVILTKMIEPEKQKFSYSYNYASDSTIQSVVYNYNGLSWIRNKENVSSVSNESITVIKNYWRDKKL